MLYYFRILGNIKIISVILPVKLSLSRQGTKNGIRLSQKILSSLFQGAKIDKIYYLAKF